MARDDRQDSDVMKNALAVLEMVGILHERGYEHLRVAPGMSPSGMSWRCSVTHRGNIRPDHGAKTIEFYEDTVHYTSAAGNRFFDWEDAQEDTPDRLADKFEQRFPEILENATGADPEYVAWYVTMLELARQGSLPIAYADWYDDPDPRWLPTTAGFESGLPMPPI